MLSCNVWQREEVISSGSNYDEQGRILGDVLGLKIEKTSPPGCWNTVSVTWTLGANTGPWHTPPYFKQGPLPGQGAATKVALPWAPPDSHPIGKSIQPSIHIHTGLVPGPLQIPNSMDAQVAYVNRTVFAQNPHTSSCTSNHL